MTINSSSMEDHPTINLNYLSDESNYDIETLIHGLKFCRTLAAQAPLSGFLRKEISPGLDIQTDQQWTEYIRTTCETVYHPSGTCRMGGNEDSSTVVTPDLRIKGLNGIRVCDASVFPSMVTVNINNTVMMLAEKAADMVISDANQAAVRPESA